ncbi:MAG: FUSC family protein, partial [Neisseriaceae bacterium]|nr:FUSC family protein [Neisseriaceae bacterium]
MLSQVLEVRKFLYSHFFLAGLRQAIGMLIPAVLLGLLFQRFDIGIIATFGAACTAIIDQPGGSARRSRRNEMLWGSVLACLTYTLTGLAALHPSMLFVLVISLTFLFSMFSVFGKRGALISAACSFLMILSMHNPLPPLTVLAHGGITLLGGLFYMAYSDILSKVFWYKEERQTLADSLFATAQYVQARADLYNEKIPLDDCYRNLIRLQSTMIDKHQATRNLVIRNMPKNQQALENPLRIRIWNTFINMVDLLDILVATHSDYVVIRQKLGGSDIMLFMHDTLAKLSMDLERSALAAARGRPIEPRHSVKAELRAIDYELQQYKANHLDEQDGETYTLLLQLSRRLKKTHQCVQDIFANINAGPNAAPIAAVRRPRYLSQFLSRNETRLGLLTSNLTLKSPTFRYAVRVSIAAFCAMSLAYFILPEAFASHAYWILMTCLLIMKPGYALTKQRNRWRLVGTLAGCFVTVALIKLNFTLGVYFGIMFVCMVFANSLLLLHYTASTMFISVFVLLAFHFLREGPMLLIGERALDTLIGSAIAY